MEEDLRAFAQGLEARFSQRTNGTAKLQTDFIFFGKERPVDDWTIALVEAADGVVIESSESDLRLALLAGQARGRQLPLLLLRSQRSAALRDVRFVGAESVPILTYESAESLAIVDGPYRELNGFVEELQSRWESGRYHAARLVSEVWFGEGGGDIHVICPPSYDNLESAHSTSRNYIHLDKFGDKDAFLEVAVFLSRVYGYRAIPHTPEEFPARQLLRDHLIVIGGPGFEEVGDGNAIAREIMSRVTLGLRYSDDPPELAITRGEASKEAIYRAEIDSAGRLVADYGVFARMRSPFNPDRVVVLIQGVHTAGVLGASQAFTNNAGASANLASLQTSLGVAGDWNFVVPMRVELIGNEVLVPKIEPGSIFSLSS